MTISAFSYCHMSTVQQVNAAIHCIPDCTLSMEVQQFCYYHEWIQELMDHISKLEDELFDFMMGKHKCITCLAKADAIRRIWDWMPQDI
jgi:hypothetical protein